MEDNVGIAEDTEEQEKQRKAAKLRWTEYSMCLKEVMRTKAGRHVIWEHLDGLGSYRNAFNPDPYIHAHESGFKAAGLKLMEEILTACPDEHQIMFAEHKYKEESNDG
jgi:hypothetical protein